MHDIQERDELIGSLRDITDVEPSFTDQNRLFCFTVSGEQAEEVWLRLRSRVAESGYWPVLLGTTDDCEEQIYAINNPEDLGFESTADILNKAGTIDPVKWLEKRFTEEPDNYTTDEDDDDGETEHHAMDAYAKKYQFYTVMDLERKFHQEVHFALIPTQNSWEAPAHLMFGGWNECPLPEEHVAMFKYWAEKWGAEVFAIAGDVVEMRVNKPPTTDEAATALAREQFVYCSDIVHQGTETVRALAREIKGSNGWFFWWD